MSRRPKCPLCAGTGLNMHDEVCPRCQGRGFAERIHADLAGQDRPSSKPPLDHADAVALTVEHLRSTNTLVPNPGRRGTVTAPVLKGATGQLDVVEVYDERAAAWVTLTGLVECEVNIENLSAADKVTFAMGVRNESMLSARSNPTYTLDLTFVDTPGDRAQEILLDRGFVELETSIAVQLRDGERMEVEAVSTALNKSRPNTPSANQLHMHFTCKSATLRQTPGRSRRKVRTQPASRAPTPDVVPQPTPLPAAQALLAEPGPCHVCGEDSYVKNRRGQPEHPTCAAWGGAA